MNNFTLRQVVEPEPEQKKKDRGSFILTNYSCTKWTEETA